MASEQAATVVVGGTSGLGHDLAALCVESDERVVIAGRDAERCADAAAGLGGCESVVFDLAEPEGIAAALADLGPVSRLALVAIERDENTVRDYDLARAANLVTMKLLGYTEVVHQLAPRFEPDAAIVVYGGQAQARPYPGSTTVSTVNGGVVGMVRSLAVELAPVRVNALHPGIVGDSPYWEGKPREGLEAIAARTPIGRLATMREISEAAHFLLTNGAVNGVDLAADGGWALS